MDEVLNELERNAVVDVLNGVGGYEYYVYALCEKTNEGKLVPFYIGKGKGYRVWAHEKGQAEEEQYIIDNYLVEEERQNELDKVSAKHEKIRRIKQEGKNIEKIIIKWGMTTDQAFMAESALINLLSLSGVKIEVSQETDKLTNIANGHSSEGEKGSECVTEAKTVEQFYNDYAKPPVRIEDLENSGKGMVFISMNTSYEDCLSTDGKNRNYMIKQLVRGFWRMRSNNLPEYLFAMYGTRIVGVYEITGIHSILEFNREDWPLCEGSEIRINDTNLFGMIWNWLEKSNGGLEQSVESIYNVSSNDANAKEIIDFFEKNYSNHSQNDFKNLCARKYYVLEDISETHGEELISPQLIGCRIKGYKANNFNGRKELKAKDKQ